MLTTTGGWFPQSPWLVANENFASADSDALAFLGEIEDGTDLSIFEGTLRAPVPFSAIQGTLPIVGASLSSTPEVPTSNLGSWTLQLHPSIAPCSNPLQQHVPNSLTGATYSMAFLRENSACKLRVNLDVGLIGDISAAQDTTINGKPLIGPLVDGKFSSGVWEETTNAIWNARGFTVEDPASGIPFAIEIDVNFVPSDQHPNVLVRVHEGDDPERSANALNWFTGENSGWDVSLQGRFVAHEIGHLLGIYDEYGPDGTILPSGAMGCNVGAVDSAQHPTNPIQDCTSIMGSLENGTVAKERHYQHFLNWLNGHGTGFVFGPAPPAPPLVTGAPVVEGPVTSVPEPSSFLLIGVVVLACCLVNWWKKIRHSSPSIRHFQTTLVYHQL
ncbi:hypothetical protein ACFL2H_08520 [Planctomycetota bacterium]